MGKKEKKNRREETTYLLSLIDGKIDSPMHVLASGIIFEKYLKCDLYKPYVV
jgi:hypothetical protein